MNTTPNTPSTSNAPQSIELYAIKDTLIGFSQPFFAQSRPVALRSFIGSVRATTPNIANTFPENKELYQIGVMNLDDGSITTSVEFVARAISYVEDTEVK